ncbi:MAG: hypothetical protein L6Q59_05445 [Ignavibacteriaceae bacterium]|nr:hypothetical protein [Ignavibacteriaceae bacterium]
MSKKLAAVAFFVAFFAVTSFAQETFTHPTAKVSVTLPAGWTYEIDGETIVASAPDGGIGISFSVIANDALDAALSGVEASLSEQFSSVNFGEAQTNEVNGLGVRYVEGQADGLEAMVAVVDAPAANTSLVISAFADAETLQKYAEDVQMILGSISAAH